MKRDNNNILTNLLLSLLVVVLMASCNNNANHRELEGKASNDPCIITPKLKEVLKEYVVNGIEDGYIIVGQNNKDGRMRYGCIDLNGKIILPLRYSSLSFAGDNLLIAEDFDKNKNFNKGCINLKGKKIIPIQYEVIRPRGDYFMVQKDQKFGIFDKNGKEVVPLDYDYILEFYPEFGIDGTVPYKYEGAFYLDKGGNVKVVNLDRERNPHYGIHQNTPIDFQRTVKDGKYGYVNYLGQEIPCTYQDASKYFSEGLAAVVMNNKVGFIDVQGNIAIPFQFEYSEPKFHVSSYCYHRDHRKRSQTEYDSFWYYGFFSDGYACMIKNGKYGFIDRNGKTVIPYEYSWASRFHHGTAVVEKKYGKGEKYGLIDKNNTLILPIEYDLIQYYPDAEAYEVVKNGKIGLYSGEGKCLIPCQYDDDPFFFYGHDGFSRVEKDGKYGLIDRNGIEVLPCQYDDFHTFSIDFGEFVEVSQNGKHGIVDLNNQIIVPFEFESAGRFGNNKNLFRVKKDGQIGFYDRCGNCTLD